MFWQLLLSALIMIAPANAETEVNILDELTELSSKTKNTEIEEAKTGIYLVQPGLGFERDVFTLDRKAACKNPEKFAQNSCEALGEVCTKKYGDRSCWGGLISPKRFESPVFKKRVYAYAAKVFYRTLLDSKWRDQCCQSVSAGLTSFLPDADAVAKEKCFQTISSTRMYLLKGRSIDDQYADTTMGRDHYKVRATEARLLNCRNEQCVDFIIHHELGHACQFAAKTNAGWVDIADEMKTDRNFSIRCATVAVIAKKDIKRVYGEDYLNCVTEELTPAWRKYYEQSPDSACWGDWLREVFADTSSFLDDANLEHWGWPCMAATDNAHGPRTALAKCLMTLPVIKANFCGSK